MKGGIPHRKQQLWQTYCALNWESGLKEKIEAIYKEEIARQAEGGMVVPKQLSVIQTYCQRYLAEASEEEQEHVKMMNHKYCLCLPPNMEEMEGSMTEDALEQQLQSYQYGM